MKCNIPYPVWIGVRYAGLSRGQSRKKDRFVSFVAGSAMVGIALGVAALIVVLSVMTGFQVKVRDRMLSVLPHIQLYHLQVPPRQLLADWEQWRTVFNQHEAVLGASPFVSAPSMLVNGQRLQGVQVRGILPETEGQVSELPTQIVQGNLNSLQAGTFGLILGESLAQQLGLQLHDKVTLISAQGSVSPAGFTPRMRSFTIVGLFSSGHSQYDQNLAFVHAQDAVALFRQQAQAGARLRIQDMMQAPEVAKQLQHSLPTYWWAQDWTQENRSWFAAVKTEKRMMFLILALIVAVAAFNLLSSLVMSVKDKQHDIAILRTMGASSGAIASIFLVQGALIGLIGTLAGVGLGCAIAYHIDVIIPFFERLFGVHFLDPNLYFISQLPSQVELEEVLRIAITAFVLSLLATLYPSWRAARLQPAKVLRHA